MPDAINPITANPDTNNPTAFAVQSDLAWSQLKTAIPQMNGVIAAFNLNDLQDVSTTSQAIGAGAKTFTVSAGKSFQPGQTLTFADAALPAANLMQAIVNSYSGTSLSVTVIQTRGTGTYASWVVSLSSMPMLEYDSSILRVTTGNGYGSTNTKIRRLTTVANNTAGTDLLYADSATLGGSVTVLTAGWYVIRISELSVTSADSGVSINSNQLTTNFLSITNTAKLLLESVVVAVSNRAHGECVALLIVGDVLRIHTSGAGLVDGDAATSLYIQKISLSGVSTGSGGGGGGGGAPTDAQYIVAVADATLTNERVSTSSVSVLSNIGTAGQIEFQRAAISGDVTIPLNSNVSVIPAGALTNAMQATMAANTVSVNATALTASPTNLPVLASNLVGRGTTGNLQSVSLAGSAEISAAGVLKTKGSFAFNYTMATSNVMADPGNGFIRFDTASILTLSQIAIDPIMLGGRDITPVLNDLDVGGKFCYISNNATGTALGILDIAAINNNTTHYTIELNTANNRGSIPAAGEEILIFYYPVSAGLDTAGVLAMDVVRTNASGFLIDKLGVVISGAGAVADYAALVALDELTYKNFVIITESLNRAAMISDGTTFLPLQGQYIQEQVNTAVNRVVACAAVTTWAVTSSGGGSPKVILTSSGAVSAHGLTVLSNGASLYLTNSPANWPTGDTIIGITTVTSTTVLLTDVPFVASMGAPTFAGVNIDIPVAAIILPVLRLNSRVIFEATPTFPAAAAGTASTTNKIVTKLNTTQITDYAINAGAAGTSRSFPFRSGFKNMNNLAVQNAIYGPAVNGFTAGGMPNAAAVATSVVTALNIFLAMNLVDTPLELAGYTVIIQG